MIKLRGTERSKIMSSIASQLIIKMLEDMNLVVNRSLFYDPMIGTGYQFSFKKQNLIITKFKGATQDQSFYELHVKEENGFTSFMIDQSFRQKADEFVKKLESPLIAQLAKEKKFSF